MPSDNDVKNIQRKLKQNASVSKYIPGLRQENALDMLFDVNGTTYTLLMHFAEHGNYTEISNVLSGQNAASILIVNNQNQVALQFAVSAACDNANYNLAIVELLLRQNA